MKYNPALDGLRAVAILLVILTHTMRQEFPGGWIGVDVFFVLSGYLITSILATEICDTGEISLRRFYWRRALRLMPALAVLLAFQFARGVIDQDHRWEIWDATLAAGAYLENWNAIYNFAPLDVLGHTWSLATEEQFYFIWPLLLPLIFGKRALWWMGGAIAAMIAARFICRPLGYPALEWNLFLRPVGLLIGCALAFIGAKRQLPAYVAPAVLVGLFALALLDDHRITLMPVATSLLAAGLIVCLQSPGTVTAAFSWEPARYIGKISYGLYLYHWPLYVLGERWKPRDSHHLFSIGLMMLIFAAGGAVLRVR